MAPGRVELPNPIKLFQNAASHFQNKHKSQKQLDLQLPEGQKLADEDMPKVAVYAAATEPALSSPATYNPRFEVPAGPITKEDLGRATWTLLHTLAAQYPSNPTKRQQKDVKALVDLMTRIYPCSDCAKHFGELVRRKPPQVGSGEELQQWMCMAHNDVNQSIGKPAFNCKLAGARWGTLDCGSELVCSMEPGH